MKSIDEDIADGIKYGFPACCVLAFVARGGTANGTQALDHGLCDRENPYVPCGFFHTPDYYPVRYDLLTLEQEVWDEELGRYV